MYAPELVSIVCEGDEARVWMIMDNGQPDATLSGSLTLTAHSLSTGAVLGGFRADVSLKMGERKCVLTGSIAGLPRNEVMLVARFGTLGANALLDEPKALRLPAPATLSIRLRPGMLELTTPTPLVDLWLSDAGRSDCFGANVLSCPTPGSYRVGYDGSGAALEARSLSGIHAIELSRED